MVEIKTNSQVLIYYKTTKPLKFKDYIKGVKKQ